MKHVPFQPNVKKKHCPIKLRIAQALAPAIKAMINDPNVQFSRPDPTGTARLADPRKKKLTLK